MSFPHIRPFRFGVQCSRASTRSEWIDLARRTEANGFDCLTMPDHFTDQLAPVPALQAVADATTTLRVGALVWDNDYKHPVVLAKELATIDLLSEGRLEIGIGAGWMISDYEQAGMPYDAAGVRIDRFIEGLEIIKRAMNEGAFSFSGKHYTINNYDGLPKPIQRPCPPILIGGGGKRVLSFAAREADIIGINGTMTAGVVGPDAISSMTADAVEEKVGIVRSAAGPRLADIEMNIRAFFVKVTDDASGTISGMAQMIGVEPTMVADTPFALIGPVNKIVDDLLARRERWGFSYVIVGAEDVDSFAPVVAALNGK
ncbi:MAG: TIGR03621 family F420-dependent LLM class oxidoreductase [Actinobacteria bacterium]|jgi:probable F420-dependent oxidoreductase|nr:TIGR03621 family F420-dependent LLM class oxidoreductase [Actinomycetota bacterium]NBP53887.1 TIGR03621 family F420-dependent LLM class oxidoreductase [Actinomycetota bacterium]